MYDIYQQRIAECDQQLEKHLAHFADTVPPQATEEAKKKKGKQYKNNPQFHLADELQRITGVDLTRIDGIDVMVAQTLISEVGLDMSRWKTEAHFASWLGLCPDNRTSGDKVLSRGTRHVVNRAATSLRVAATTLLRSQTYLRSCASARVCLKKEREIQELKKDAKKLLTTAGLVRDSPSTDQMGGQGQLSLR
jgi:transposase